MEAWKSIRMTLENDEEESARKVRENCKQTQDAHKMRHTHAHTHTHAHAGVDRSLQ